MKLQVLKDTNIAIDGYKVLSITTGEIVELTASQAEQFIKAGILKNIDPDVVEQKKMPVFENKAFTLDLNKRADTDLEQSDEMENNRPKKSNKKNIEE
jgi:hypothetical protein